MYCRECGKGSLTKELCRRCAKNYAICEKCDGLFNKKEIKDGVCFLCRGDKEHLQ